jgi:hypothetical protein
MSDTVVVALIPSVTAILIALLAYAQARNTHARMDEVKISVDGGLTALKEEIAKANLAEGRIQGAAEARSSDAQARLDRAAAAALVLDPQPPKEV